MGKRVGARSVYGGYTSEQQCRYMCLDRRANKTSSRCEIRYSGKPKQREYIGDCAGKTLIMMIDGCEMNAHESTSERLVVAVGVWKGSGQRGSTYSVLTLARKRVFGRGDRRRDQATKWGGGSNNKCCVAVNLDKSLHDGSHYVFLQ